MKKILAVFLALGLIVSVCAAFAEEEIAEEVAEVAEEVTEVAEEAGNSPLEFKTLGSAMEEAVFEDVEGAMDNYYVMIVEAGDKYYRLIADMDETAISKQEAIFNIEDVDNLDAAVEDFNEYIKTLPVSKVEEITAAPIEQTVLDALVGLTISELEDRGFEQASSGWGGEDEEVVFTMANGLFNYDFVVYETAEDYQAHSEDGDYSAFTVKSCTLAGISNNALNLRYHADGTAEPEEDPWGDFSELVQYVSNLVAAAEKTGEVDIETLVSQIKEEMPDQSEEDIRSIIEMFASLATDGEEVIEETVAGD